MSTNSYHSFIGIDRGDGVSITRDDARGMLVGRGGKASDPAIVAASDDFLYVARLLHQILMRFNVAKSKVAPQHRHDRR